MVSRPTRPPPPPPPPPAIPHPDDSTIRDQPLPIPPRQRRPSRNTTKRLPDFQFFGNRSPDPYSSSDDDELDPVSAPQRPSSHSRSMSHPFPSLFSKKKKSTDHSRYEDSTSLDDDQKPLPQPTPRAPQMPTRKVTRGPADYATGNCMTCSSLVRWPKELYTFRCTICLTINDLKPLPPDPPQAVMRQPAREPHQLDDSHSPPRQDTRPPHSISLDRTRALIRQSLRASIRRYISQNTERDDGDDRDPSPPGPWPDRISSRPSDEISTPSNALEKRAGSRSKGDPQSGFVYNAVFDDFADHSAESNAKKKDASETRSYSTSFPESRSATFPRSMSVQRDDVGKRPHSDGLDPKKIFKPVEDYLVLCFSSHTCVNNSFVPRRSSVGSRHVSDAARRRPPEARRQPRPVVPDDAPVSELDPKLLLLGDFAENGTWWTGGREDTLRPRAQSKPRDEPPSIVNSRSPRIDWGIVMEWYRMILNSVEPWHKVYEEEVEQDPMSKLPDDNLQQLESILLRAQESLQRHLLKCIEMLLKRPGRLMKDLQDVRFLLMILANPLLVPSCTSYSGQFQHPAKGKATARNPEFERHTPGRHSGIIKRVLGLLANSSEKCHHYMPMWLSKLPESLFLQIKDLIASFVTYRLTRVSERTIEPRFDMTGGLVPQMSNARSANTPANLHAALSGPGPSKKEREAAEPRLSAYPDDWQIKAGAKVMAMVFTANKMTYVRRSDWVDGRTHGHLLTTSDFYNSLVDCLDFKEDFDMWEAKTSKFVFCQYPFFLSIWAKIRILEHDAKRQMHGKAREAFFDSILTHKAYIQHLVLHIRRECLVDDSLKQVSEVVGSGSEDIKKALRIEFRGEEGVDAGGLRKEWFLLLVREVFNPDHGLFIYDEDSQFCYFNPNSFETSDQFFLIGVVLGLAIYNSTILDVAFPPFAFRKLLASAPSAAPGSAAHPRPIMTYTLDDLAEYRPALARGLRQLLEFEGDVQSTFCLDFVVEVEKYGTRHRVPLMPGGESRMVTNSNRREYVDLYVRYLLDVSVSRQFEPFKRGFFTVCAGNALSLFMPEEIELLVRGSDEPLDIESLRAVAEYTNWPNMPPKKPKRARSRSRRGEPAAAAPAAPPFTSTFIPSGSSATPTASSDPATSATFSPDTEPTLRWFWATFERASARDQRRLLLFITGSDRIPATGATSLVIRINCLGEDEGRFPTARTCFNMLSLYLYRSRERLEDCLWRAVHESEGFGLR